MVNQDLRSLREKYTSRKSCHIRSAKSKFKHRTVYTNDRELPNSTMPIIGVACDHAGFEYKQRLIAHLKSNGHTVVDHGYQGNESVDYPDYAQKLAMEMQNKEVNIGFQFCGSGNGINMAINKHNWIRSALCWNTEVAKLSRSHNDANVCSMPARFISFEETLDIVQTFLNTDFKAGRHQARIDKFSQTSLGYNFETAQVGAKTK